MSGRADCATAMNEPMEQTAMSGRRSYDYWCTWETQRALWKGVTCERDNIDEATLLGPDGWARTLFGDSRRGLHLVLDDGWDVPYGAVNKGAGYAAFGSLVPDPVRFSSLKGSTAARLRELNRRIRDLGWRGAGLWVAAQAAGETYSRKLPERELKEDLKRKLGESADAGIGFWKVDWGVHSLDIWYREMMSDLAREYAPETVVDHSTGFDNALNGVAHPYDRPKPFGMMDIVGKTGRIIGNADFEPVRERYTRIMSFSDSFRTYDTLGPMTSATALERAVFELMCADATKSRCMINVEDEPLIGAALGLGIGVMRAAVWPDPAVPEPEPKQRRLKEIARCVAWREFAPVFGSDRGCPVLFSAETGEENWHFEPKSTWWSAAFGRTLFQRAPMAVSRGMPLPSVAPLEGENPLVAASRSPDTGAIAVASLPMLTIGKGRHTPKCDVSLDAVIGPVVPLGVFGRFESVTVGYFGAKRVFARDLAGERDEDITAACTFSAGRIAIPGDVLARIGTSSNGAADPSSPGAVVVLR